MVSAVQRIIERINGQRNSVDRLSQPIAVGDLDQQVVHFFIDDDSSGKDVFPGMVAKFLGALSFEDYIRRENSRKISKHFRYLP